MLGARKSGKSKNRVSKLVREGQVVSKFYDLSAGRPYPALTSTEQSITVTLSLASANFFAISATVPQFAGLSLALNQFARYAEYVGLFDQYRFEQIEVWLNPNQVSASAQAEIATCVDLDDATTPTLYEHVIAKQGSLSGSGQAGHYHKWKPHVAVAVYSGAFTSFANAPASWIDSGSPGVQHYGLKVASGLGAVIGYNLDVRAVVSFRGPGIP